MSKIAPWVMIALVSASCIGGELVDEKSGEATIEGSYELVRRDLPDGSTLEPPAIFGFLTYTEGHRIFVIRTPGPDGNMEMASRVSTYRLSGSEYHETNKYAMLVEEGRGSRPRYRYSGSARSSSVTANEQTVEFRDPHGTALEFTRDGMTATVAGYFVDHWVKVE